MEFKKVECNFNPSGNTINLVEGENLKDLTSNLKSSTTVTSTVGQPVIKLLMFIMEQKKLLTYHF